MAAATNTSRENGANSIDSSSAVLSVPTVTKKTKRKGLVDDSN